MAWNESFSAGDAGGWGGDASFVTSASKDNSSSRTAERLAVPVTISDLVDAASTAEDKYSLGEYHFSTVLFMGNVESADNDDTMITYIITDPENPEKSFKAVIYLGLSDGEASSLPMKFAEGTRVLALGKLRSFNGTSSIMAYDVKEVQDDKQYHIFTLEAKVAKLYFSKGVPQRLQQDGCPSLRGLCVGAPLPTDAKPTAGATHVKQEPTFASQSSTSTNRIYNTQVSAGHGMAGTRGKIMEMMTAEKDNINEQGMNIDVIQRKTGIANRDMLVNDLAYLVGEGHLYNTINDECFALIA